MLSLSVLQIPLKDKSPLILTENDLRVQRLLRDSQHNRTRADTIASIKGGDRHCREVLAKQLLNKADRYRLREVTGMMAIDDPVDIELFFIYLLTYAVCFDRQEFPELYQAINKTQAVINNTYELRRRRPQTAAKSK